MIFSVLLKKFLHRFSLLITKLASNKIFIFIKES